MTEMPAGRHDGPGRYEIRLKGHLDARWAAWSGGLTLTSDSDGTTIIHGPVTGQAALCCRGPVKCRSYRLVVGGCAG